MKGTPEALRLDSIKRGTQLRSIIEIVAQRKILVAERAFCWCMDARRPLYIAPARVPLRPLARLAVRFLGPGPLRLRMVKYVHDLDRGEPTVEPARAA